MSAKQPPMMSRINQINMALFLTGSLLISVSYGSLVPLFFTLVAFATGKFLLLTTPLGGIAEQRMFDRLLFVGFVAAGVAAIYANQLQDPSQLFSDTAGFYDMATFGAQALSLEEIESKHEGALGIIIWRQIYDIFEAMGFEKERYIGITFNSLVVALSGVFGIKIIRVLFGNDQFHFRRFGTFASLNGLVWLFASIHIRDGMIMLAVAILIYLWVCYLSRPDSIWRLVLLVFGLLVSVPVMKYLRGEFAFVPLSMMLAAFAALVIGNYNRLLRNWTIGLVAAVLIVLILFFLWSDFQIILELLSHGHAGYTAEAETHHTVNSFGMTLIVNQPLPVRLAFGSVYLYVYPIPFWSGFQFESVYRLFNSFSVVSFYFILPMLAIVLSNISSYRKNHLPVILFLVFVSFGFTLAVAGTSLETRHIGAFLTPLFVLASIPDTRNKSVRAQYKYLLSIVVVGVFTVHIAWVMLKFL